MMMEYENGGESSMLSRNICKRIHKNLCFRSSNAAGLARIAYNMTSASENGGHPFDEMPIEQIRDAENELDRLYQQNQGGMSGMFLL